MSLLPLFLRYWPYLAGAAAALALALVALHIKAELDSIPKLKADRDAFHSAYDGEHKAFVDSEAARRADQHNAVAAIDASQTECEARITEARRSSSAIRTLTHACPTFDASHCPVRGLLDAGGLRDALGASR